ncbi:MAG: hypothetical protein WC554_17000 [Clostridia bacterium]
MGRYGDNAPVGHTCPDINEAQSIASNIKETIDASLGVFEDTKTYCDDLVKQLELLRSENSKLRDWGNEYYEMYEKLRHNINFVLFLNMKFIDILNIFNQGWTYEK